MKGKLIVFVGPDGAGKTTLIKEIRKQIKKPVLILNMGLYHKRTAPFRIVGNITKRDSL